KACSFFPPLFGLSCHLVPQFFPVAAETSLPVAFKAWVPIERLCGGATVLEVTSYDRLVLCLPKFLITALAWLTLLVSLAVHRVHLITQVCQIPVQVSLPAARALLVRARVAVR